MLSINSHPNFNHDILIHWTIRIPYKLFRISLEHNVLTIQFKKKVPTFQDKQEHTHMQCVWASNEANATATH